MVDLKPNRQPTRLTGGKGDHKVEMWVEIEGRPLEIYGISEGDDGILEGWIVSEIDKVGFRPLDRSKLSFLMQY
jgi:hypothetical protein